MSRQGMLGMVILVAATLIMGCLAGLPYLWYSVTNSQLAESRVEMQFIEAKLKSVKDVRTTGLTASDNIEPMFAAGATSGTSLAGLQTLVSRLAEENGMVIERTQPLQTEQTSGLAALRMEVEASGSLESLRGYLLAIEQGQPYIFINQAKISSQEANSEDATALPSDKLTVALQLESYGWWETKQ
jgi:hypothetical protein